MNMARLSANVPPKFSARNSADDFSDVFGGPPKYISSKQFKDPRKAHSSSQPSSAVSVPVQSEIPVFGETRKRYANDEFFNDFFNGGTVSVASRSTSRNASSAQSPLPKTDCKAFGNTVSPLTPKLRQPVNSSKQADYPAFGVSSHYKFFNDSSVTSSSQSSLPDPSSHSKQGLKKQHEYRVFPPRSSNSRFQTFLEPGESKPGSAARLSNDTLYSTAPTTPCSNTSDDELGNNIQGLNGHKNGGVSKLGVENPASDNPKGSNSGEKDDNGSEKSRLSASTGPFQRPAISPLENLQLQHKLRSCRDWIPEPKGKIYSNEESGSLSVGSPGFSSTRKIHSNIGPSNIQEVSQEIGPKRLSTNITDSGEESDELGSYVIEMDNKRGETIAFLPERDIQNPLISSIKETMESAKKESLPAGRPMKHMNHDAKEAKLRLHFLLQKTYSFDPFGDGETKMQTLQSTKGKGRGWESSKMTPKQDIPETSARPALTPAMEQGAKEDLINESNMAALWDPCSIDPSTTVCSEMNYPISCEIYTLTVPPSP